jgi:hypothetical protein
VSERAGATGSSLTDIMASLVAVFVLLFVAAQNNVGGGLQVARDALIKQLQGRLKAAGVPDADVKADPNDPGTVLIVLPDSVLFERSARTMSAAGQRVVATATRPLVEVLCTDSVRRRLDQMVVEGHTDNTIPPDLSYGEGRRYNLELSQARSMDFVTRSMQVILDDELRLQCFLKLVSATGRGQEDSLPGVPADAAAQRRVVLRIRLSTGTPKTSVVLPDTIRG